MPYNENPENAGATKTTPLPRIPGNSTDGVGMEN